MKIESLLYLKNNAELSYFFAKSNSPQNMFNEPTRPRTFRKSGFKNILTEVSMVYAEKIATNMPTAKIIKEKISRQL